MKQLGSLVPIILLLGLEITGGLAAAELTASQQVLPQVAAVGETATVTLTLTYNGGNATQIVVVPSLPQGIVTDMPGAQTASLYPGDPLPISYPVRAEQSGSYLITSLISYTEERTTRRLNMVSQFTATGGSGPATPADQRSPASSMPSMLDQPSPLDAPIPNAAPSSSGPVTPASSSMPEMIPTAPSAVLPGATSSETPSEAVMPTESAQSDNGNSTAG
jgi:hypothetical protein